MADNLIALPGAADPDPFKRLVLGIYSYLRSRLPKDVSVENVMRLARQIAGGALNATDSPGWNAAATWKKARPARLDEAKRQSNLGSVLRIVVSLVEMKEPLLVSMESEGEGSNADAPPDDTDNDQKMDVTTCARFVDVTNDESIWTLEVMGQELIDKFTAQRRRGGYAEVLAMPVALPVNIGKRPDSGLEGYRQGFFLHVFDIRSSSSMLDFLGASREERGVIDDRLDQLRREGTSVLDYIVSELAAR